MDFFNSTQTGQNPTDSAPGIDGFAKAIQDRFGPQSTVFTPLPMLVTPSPRMTPRGNTIAAVPSTFEAITPATLADFLARSKPLVLDIRPHNAFFMARISTAISFSVPSTLLKRPLFSTQRLGAMLSSHAARIKFSAWADHSNILVYDADSISVSPTSNINGLLQKFKNEGYTGNLAYLSGGFQAVWKERRDLTTSEPPSVDDEEEDDTQQPVQPSSVPPQAFVKPTLRTRHLPMSAFSIASTTASHTSSSNNPSNYHSGATEAGSKNTTQAAFNPFFDSIRQNVELSQGVTERIPLRLSSRVRRRITDIPFPWLQNIASHAAPDPDSPPLLSDSSASETDNEVEMDPPDVPQAVQDEATEALALQFYRIELAEQRRLQAVMEFHSNESRNSKGDAVEAAFPYSITAGIEKGAKNRYRHIWPFEHARVRLQPSTSPSSDKDDYVNASYVQPLGTNKRYIATQGPLDATFADFWTLVWQQDVRVIVMLTREIEGAQIKCGRYWENGQYGHLTLTLISESGDTDHQMEKNVSGPSAFFPDFKAERKKERLATPAHNKTIRRVFHLRHTKYPEARERQIIQLQYLGWPDMTVPDDPRGILRLVQETNAAVEETNASIRPMIWPKASEHRPVLLHCSAGVGRTGGFIAVDAILDGLRRELEHLHLSTDTSTKGAACFEGDRMDVDPQISKQDLVRSSNPLSKNNNIPTAQEATTRQWAEQVSELNQNEAPLNPNRHTPKPPPAADNDLSGRLEANRSPRSSEERSSTEISRLASVSSSMTSFSPLAQAFPSTIPKKGKSTMNYGSANNFAHDRSRAFSTPTSGVSGFLSPLRHRASVSHVLPGPYQLSPPTSLSSSPAPFPSQSASVSDSNSGPELQECTSLDIPANGSSNTAQRPRPGSNLAATVAENSSSSAPSSRSLSPPTAQPPTSSAVATSSSSSANSLPLKLNLSSSHKQAPEQTFIFPNKSQSETKYALSSGTAPNYTLPRTLHKESSEAPFALSTLEDPILAVLQDMREQRMSLCQSLRQYVFVHAAVIEGVLQIVDEEKRMQEVKRKYVPMDSRPDVPAQHEHNSSSTIPTISTGKRGASPTELPIEDKQGGVRLAKRPSVKKKTNSEESYHILVDTPSVQTPKPVHPPTLEPLAASRESSSEP